MERRGLLVVLSGPAGSGKSTLADEAAARHPDIVRSVTATTRAPREGEESGRDYHFLSEDEFRAKLDEDYFLEYAEFGGHLYGTPRTELEAHLDKGRVVLLVIDVQGARQVRERTTHAMFVFLLPPDRRILRERLCGRGTECVSDIQKRLAIAEREIAALEEYDFLVINDDRDAAVQDLLAVIDLAREHHIRGGERVAWEAGAYEGWHRGRYETL